MTTGKTIALTRRTFVDKATSLLFNMLSAAVAAAAKKTSVVSDSMQPHRRQPIRLPNPWDSPGKNNGVGCHFLLQCMKVKSEELMLLNCGVLEKTLESPLDCKEISPDCLLGRLMLKLKL